MRDRYLDWNCHLLSGIHETLTNSEECAEAIRYLNEHKNIRTFCMMPTFLPFCDSVASFRLRRDRSLQRLSEAISASAPPTEGLSGGIKPYRILSGVCVAIEPGAFEIEHLDRLAVPFANDRYLPIRLPVSDFADWIDFEINRLLYRAGLHLWFVSFEIACLFYPPEIIKKLARIPNSVFQFSYQSLENPSVCGVIRLLLSKRATVLLGSSVDCLQKSYWFDIEYYLQTAKRFFTPAEYAQLLKYNQTLPRRHPKYVI